MIIANPIFTFIIENPPKDVPELADCIRKLAELRRGHDAPAHGGAFTDLLSCERVPPSEAGALPVTPHGVRVLRAET
jgi:hypothetical protein